MKKICKMCGKSFIPKSPRKIFCERRCFKLFDYRKHREDERMLKNKFPVFNCPTCNNVISLSFHPVKNQKMWTDFKCPHCNVLMINVIDSIMALDIAIE